VLGELDVATIDTDAVLRVLDPIWPKMPETATRIRGRIESVLDFAGRNGSNPARWKGHLEHRLAKRNKTGRPPRIRGDRAHARRPDLDL
jgi:hypothetical protein